MTKTEVKLLMRDECYIMWVNISRVIFGVSRPQVHQILLFNAALIVVDNTFYRLSISLFVLEIFAVKLESCRKTY